MDLSVVIVSYNTRDLLRGCLRSALAETTNIDFEVIVVDNASPDGSADMVASEFESVALVALDDNVGFARACNLAVEQSSGTYILLLNPDTTVHDRALERLLEFGRAHPEAGLCGGRTLRPDGRVNPSSCWGQPSVWSFFCFATGLSTAFRHNRFFDPESLGRWQRDSVREVGVVTGCLLLASREVWDELEGFDERFWMYGEDTDLALRAHALGYRPAITPDSVVTHDVGASASGQWKRRLLLRGKVTFVTKNWSPLAARVGVSLLVTGVAMRAAGARLARRPSLWSEVWDERLEWQQEWPDPRNDRSGANMPRPSD